MPIAFTMAFQPIVDVVAETVWGYESLVRGPEGQGAGWVLDQVTPALVYAFDQACRVRAIELAGRMFTPGGKAILSINFKPNAVYEPRACIRASLEAAARAGFPHDRIMFEFTEDEQMADTGHVARIVAEYRRCGLMTALDDVGAGFAGLNLVANLATDVVKLDMALIRGIDADRRRQAIVAGMVAIGRDLGATVLAEGVETVAEAESLRRCGIRLMQGYYFARPAVERLPEVRGLPGRGPLGAEVKSGHVRHDVVAAVP